MIFREGGNCSFYYQLVSGKVRWGISTMKGGSSSDHLIEPGECFGELPLFDDEVYAASAIADEDLVIVRLRKITFLQLIKENQYILFFQPFTQRLRFKFLVIAGTATYKPGAASPPS